MSDVNDSTDDSLNNEKQDLQKSTNVKTTDPSPSEIELLTTLVKSQQEQIATIQKNSEESQSKILSEIKKMQDANPVAHGATKEEKPKVSDNDDVGATPKDKPSYAPDGNAQASIRTPADEPSKTDSIKVSKADDMPDDDDKKEESEKKADESSDKEEKSDMKKSDDLIEKSVAPDGYEYEMAKAIRPKVEIMPSTPEHAPTGYQVMKSIIGGWGGKHTNYEKSFIEGYERLLKGEYGTGFPDGGSSQ